MSNTPRVGRAARTAKPDFWYFDKLPPTARQALANAAFNWSSAGFYSKWNRGQRGYKTGKDIADRVAAADAGVINKFKGLNR